VRNQSLAEGGREPEWATPLMRRSQARGGAGAFSSQAKSLGGSENAIKQMPKGGSATIRDA